MVYFITKVNLSKLSFISIKFFCWKTVIIFSEIISFYARAKSEQKSICSPFAVQSYITWQVNLCSSAFHRPKTGSFFPSFFRSTTKFSFIFLCVPRLSNTIPPLLALLSHVIISSPAFSKMFPWAYWEGITDLFKTIKRLIDLPHHIFQWLLRQIRKILLLALLEHRVFGELWVLGSKNLPRFNAPLHFWRSNLMKNICSGINLIQNWSVWILLFYSFDNLQVIYV